MSEAPPVEEFAQYPPQRQDEILLSMPPHQRQAAIEELERAAAADQGGWIAKLISPVLARVRAGSRNAELSDRAIADASTAETEYVTGVHPSNARYQGVEHAELKRYSVDDNDPAAVGEASALYHELQTKYESAREALLTARKTLASSWEGDAAEQAGSYLDQAATKSEANTRNATLAAEVAARQSESSASFRNAMPEEKPFSWESEMQAIRAEPNPITAVTMLTTATQRQRESQEAHQQAAEVAHRFDESTFAAASQQPVFAEPPTFGGGSGTGSGGGTGTGGGVGSVGPAPNVGGPGTGAGGTGPSGYGGPGYSGPPSTSQPTGPGSSGPGSSTGGTSPASAVPGPQFGSGGGLPPGARRLPDGRVQLADGRVGRLMPDGSVLLPDGTRVLPNGQTVSPLGASSASDVARAGAGGAGIGGGAAGAGVAAGVPVGGMGFGPTGGSPSGGAGGAGGGLAAGKGVGAGQMGGQPAAAAANAGKAGGAIGGRGMMGGGMMGGAGAGRGQGAEDTEHEDNYFQKSSDLFETTDDGEPEYDPITGLIVPPPVIGE